MNRPWRASSAYASQIEDPYGYAGPWLLKHQSFSFPPRWFSLPCPELSAIDATFIYQYWPLSQHTSYMHVGNSPPAKKQKKPVVQPGCWGWLRLVIESLGLAGRVVDLPKVPDGRVGGVTGWGCWAGVAVLLAIPNLVVGCLCSLLGTLGALWGRKFYIWQGTITYTPIWDVFVPQRGRDRAGEQNWGALRSCGLPN